MRRSSSSSGCSCIGIALCVFSVAWNLGALVGQETPATTKSSDLPASDTSAPKKDPSSARPKPAESTLPPATIKYLPNKDNKLVEIRNGPTLEEYYVYEANRGKPAGPAPATITAIDITGTADDDRAELKVAYTVQIHPADQYVSVPLFLNEGLLKGFSTADGEDSTFQDKDAEKGYLWWFRGRGQHRLDLSIVVPLKKQLPSRSLVLSLPHSPVSHARIEVSHASINAKIRPEQSILDVKTATEGKSMIDASIYGPRLDLTWQPNIELRPTEISLESQTTIRVQIEADQAWLRADQQIKSLQGFFEQVAVRLPATADLIKLDDPDKQSLKFDPDNRQRAIVVLKEKTNSAQLSWTMRLPAKLHSPLTIDGFFVEGARKQVGRVGLATADGLRLFTPSDPNLLGLNAGEFPQSMGPVVRAYQFLGPPFKLSVNFDEVKPYFQVKPQLLLTASAQHLTLDGEFEFHVDRDTLSEIVLSWPNHKAEGWTIDAVDEPGVVEGYSVDDKGQITARLVKQRSGTFAVHVRARRHFKAGDDIAFTLPRPKSASRLSPSTLILVNAENVDSDLTARGETVFHLLPSSTLDAMDLPEINQGLKASVYRIDTDEQSLGLRVIPQKQRIRTESVTEAKWQDNQFRLVQRLIYDVSYERLSQIRLTIPSTMEFEHIRFFSNRDQELTPEILQTPAGAPKQVQLKLGEAMLGHFEIQARFAIPFSKETAFDPDVVATLPILASSDEPFSQTRVSLEQSDWFDAQPVSAETWRPQLNLQESWKWLAEGAQSSLKLKLARSTHVYETGSVSAALVKLNVDRSGDIAVRAQFRVTTRATSLPVQLPDSTKSTKPPTFYWDQRELSERECTESPAGSHRYNIQLPPQTEGSAATPHLLTIDYYDAADSSLGISDRLELKAPQLPKCSWTRVIWQAILPADKHMFTYPSSATPMFRWQRAGLFWSRVSDPGPDKLQQWVTLGVPGTPPPTDDLLSDRNGNSYCFSQFDSPKPLVFQTLSSPMVFLFGAGFSLAVGFVVLRLTVLRHVLTLLLMGLVVAIAGLWYAAPLELLLQPMIVGLVFPCAAILLEGWIRSHYDTGILSFEGQGDFPPIQAFGSHFVVRQSDPNEATLHRAPIHDSESGVRVESGSGVS